MSKIRQLEGRPYFISCRLYSRQEIASSRLTGLAMTQNIKWSRIQDRRKKQKRRRSLLQLLQYWFAFCSPCVYVFSLLYTHIADKNQTYKHVTMRGIKEKRRNLLFCCKPGKLNNQITINQWCATMLQRGDADQRSSSEGHKPKQLQQ